MIFYKIWIRCPKRKSKKLIEIARFGGSRPCQLVGLAPEIILHYLKSNLDRFEPDFGHFSENTKKHIKQMFSQNRNFQSF